MEVEIQKLKDQLGDSQKRVKMTMEELVNIKAK